MANSKKKAKAKKYTKEYRWEIICFLLIIIYLFLAGWNYYKFNRLEKRGIIQTVVVKSYSLTKRHGRSGTHYHAKIKYSLLGENELEDCSFDFKPDNEYHENERIQIVRDYENDFRLPVNEKEAFKRDEINGNLIRAACLYILVLFCRFLNYIFEKNRNKNKRIKKLAKKDPELKEKYKKKEKTESIILLILLAPVIFIQYLIEKIKNYFDEKKKRT